MGGGPFNASRARESRLEVLLHELLKVSDYVPLFGQRKCHPQGSCLTISYHGLRQNQGYPRYYLLRDRGR
jgi:hypothetical protein